MLTEQNKTVHGLWIGTELSSIELLTLKSFIEHGHDFYLWAYDEIKTPIPEGVTVRNANEILLHSKIFRYKNANKYGHGKGSVAGFSDLFRYKLLYEKGGWWTDMDVTCLKPFDIEEPYFFRSHHDLLLVGNVMKCEPGSELMKRCFEETERTVDENNTDWLKPVTILNENVREFLLEKYIVKEICNEDRWPEVKRFIYRNEELPLKYFFIHWMNEEWRSRGIDKNKIRYNSTLGKLFSVYNLQTNDSGVIERLYNDLTHLTEYFFR